MKNKFGFTIVEVLVVIGIIAILTVIIFPAISNIRAKNRDAEKVSDIAAIQLALSLYYNQNAGYPNTLDDLTPKFITADSLATPEGVGYLYVPLKLAADVNKCTYYHLGVELELPSAQIDTADNFSSKDTGNISNGYQYCVNGTTSGIDQNIEKMYHVRP
jgi:prepilin-type N-terminal cleavage/methylation domain-containing protein